MASSTNFHLQFSFFTSQETMKPRRIPLGIPGDYHVHLRDGPMMRLVTPTVRTGGVGIAYVMPNLVPPVTTLKQVKEYKKELQKLAPATTFLMTLYLCRELTPQLVAEAASSIAGIKCYPAGVTTNLQAGVDPNDFSAFYPIFEEMQKHGLVLNLHGEKPLTKHTDLDTEGAEHVHVLNAEPKFLPALEKLHRDFPRLKIVLEHCTTKAAIDTVDRLNQGSDEVFVAASITAHHLYITVDDVVGNPINFCKPVAKLPEDRQALVKAATLGKPWFFFGSDSAPHPIGSKSRNQGVCAGVYTQNNAIAYVAEVFDKYGKLDNLKKFVTDNGRAFYGLKDEDLQSLDEVFLVEEEHVVPEFIGEGDGRVQPFMEGQKLNWLVEWAERNA